MYLWTHENFYASFGVVVEEGKRRLQERLRDGLNRSWFSCRTAVIGKDGGAGFLGMVFDLLNADSLIP